MRSLQISIKTGIGPLFLVGTERALHGVFWEKQDAPMGHRAAMGEKAVLKKAALQIEEYLSGGRRKFDIPLHVEGTEFQKKVWKKLAEIPYGGTRSYGELAAALGAAGAGRAVGTACGKNPLCIIVPCHRVIRSDGSNGSYSGGSRIKKTLLDLEKSRF
jgi:methylated-DNA-[protein]-cysteine S-methyltransferase